MPAESSVSNALGWAGFGVNAAATAGDFLSNIFFGRRNERWAREDATTAYERQMDAWRLQNEYNTPKAQMQRLIDAGLNPNLIYSQMDGGAIAMPTPPQAQSASPAPTNIASDLAQPLLDAYLKDAQRRNIEADTEVKEKESDLKVEEIDNMKSDTIFKDTNSEYLRSLMDTQVEVRNQLKAEVDRLRQLIDLGKIELSNKTIDLAIRGALVEDEIDAIAARYGMDKLEYEFQVATFVDRQLNLQLNNNLLRSQFRVNNAQAAEIEAALPYLDRMYKANSAKSVFDAAISAKDYKLLKSFGTTDKIFGYVRDVGETAGNIMGGLGKGLGQGFMQSSPQPAGFKLH